MGLFDYDYDKLREMSIPEQEAYKRRVKIEKLQLEELERRKMARSREEYGEADNYASSFDAPAWLLWPIRGFTWFVGCNLVLFFLWMASCFVTRDGYDGFQKLFTIEFNFIGTVIGWIVGLAK